jgi:hypothetical protein
MAKRKARFLVLAVRLDPAIPGEFDASEEIERDLIKQFLLGSNFLQLANARSERIEFLRAANKLPKSVLSDLAVAVAPGAKFSARAMGAGKAPERSSRPHRERATALSRLGGTLPLSATAGTGEN